MIAPDAVHPGKVASTLPPRLAHLRSINAHQGHPVACAGVGLRNIAIVERDGWPSSERRSGISTCGRTRSCGRCAIEPWARCAAAARSSASSSSPIFVGKTPLDDDACGALLEARTPPVVAQD